MDYPIDMLRSCFALGGLLVWLHGPLASGAEAQKEVWYDAQGKPALVLPATRKPNEFVSQWDRQALEREKRAAVRRESLDGSRRPSRGADVYFDDFGYAGWAPVYSFPYYVVPRCPAPVRPWFVSWGGRGGGVRLHGQFR